MMAVRARSRGVVAQLALSLAIAAALLAAIATAPARARAQEPASWRFAPLLPPRLPGESEQEHAGRFPIGLGKIGDIEFWAPNRGLLITAGNPPAVPPGLWAYNGVEWRELASVCGATDGRIAWAGPEEFWTVSDGRPGQAGSENHGPPPLENNTLCHFKDGQVVGSYGSLAFRPDSYQPMHAAACVRASPATSSSDCWFGGEKLPAEQNGVKSQFGAFQLHWDGSSVSAVPYPADHAIADLRQFGSFLFESVRIGKEDTLTESESPSAPSDLHLITPIGVQPTFISLNPGLPRYAPEERPAALGALHLGADEDALWAGAGPVEVEGSAPGEVTILRYAEGRWSQVLGYGSDPPEGNPFTQPGRDDSEDETVASIAPEPQSQSAWLALKPQGVGQGASTAIVARISAAGQVTDHETLPAQGEGVGAKGAADKIACPASNDCWLATAQGWLFHYSDAAHRAQPEDTDPAFAALITFRPPDAGVPALVPDAPPPDDSGLPGEVGQFGALAESQAAVPETRVPVPLLSHLRSRLLHGSTLELRFHLAVRARVRLLAKRRRRVVASTPMRILQAGDRRLLLRLSPKSWPTKLDLQTHALAPLPTQSTRGAATTTVGTGAVVLPRTRPFDGTGALP